jgi:8-oxo-dGTP pyrophosphatase MutT (NUDIX family)
MTDYSLSHTHKFRRWKGLLEQNGLIVHGAKEKYSKWRSADDLFFAVVELDATTPEGHKIPPVCFLKGEIVSVLVCLIDESTGEKYNLLVKQRRICNGANIYEQVAGMVDRDDDPLAVAVKEVEEETGVQVRPDQVHRLNEEVLYSTSGTSDEAMYFIIVNSICVMNRSGHTMRSIGAKEAKTSILSPMWPHFLRRSASSQIPMACSISFCMRRSWAINNYRLISNIFN